MIEPNTYHVIERNGWSYVVPMRMDPMPEHSGPWRYRWEAQEYADKLNSALAANSESSNG